MADQPVILAGADGTTVYQLGPALATGRIVKTASADIQNGQWLVRLEMRGGEDGIDKFNEIAATCYAQAPDPQVCPSGQLAIVLDSVVQSAPTIQQPSYEADQIQISGSFTESEAKDLALVLRYGSLPVELERQSVQTVSASLGDDSLRAGIIAGIVGLALVAALHAALLPGARAGGDRGPDRVGCAAVHDHQLPRRDPGPGAHAWRA